MMIYQKDNGVVRIDISSGTDYEVGTPSRAQVAVTDDDAVPIIRIADIVDPVEEDVGSVTFVLTSSKAGEKTVRYTIQEGSSFNSTQATLDFQQVGGTGPFTKTISVPITDIPRMVTQLDKS